MAVSKVALVLMQQGLVFEVGLNAEGRVEYRVDDQVHYTSKVSPQLPLYVKIMACHYGELVKSLRWISDRPCRLTQEYFDKLCQERENMLSALACSEREMASSERQVAVLKAQLEETQAKLKTLRLRLKAKDEESYEDPFQLRLRKHPEHQKAFSIFGYQQEQFSAFEMFRETQAQLQAWRHEQREFQQQQYEQQKQHQQHQQQQYEQQKQQQQQIDALIAELQKSSTTKQYKQQPSFSQNDRKIQHTWSRTDPRLTWNIGTSKTRLCSLSQSEVGSSKLTRKIRREFKARLVNMLRRRIH